MNHFDAALRTNEIIYIERIYSPRHSLTGCQYGVKHIKHSPLCMNPHCANPVSVCNSARFGLWSGTGDSHLVAACLRIMQGPVKGSDCSDRVQHAEDLQALGKDSLHGLQLEPQQPLRREGVPVKGELHLPREMRPILGHVGRTEKMCEPLQSGKEFLSECNLYILKKEQGRSYERNFLSCGASYAVGKKVFVRF